MPTLEERFPKFKRNIEKARAAGVSDRMIESFIVSKFGTPKGTVPPAIKQAGEESFFSALGKNIAPKGDTFLPDPVELFLNVLDVPQDLATAAIAPGQEGFLSSFARGKDPSEALGLSGIPGLAADVVLDPLNVVGGFSIKGAKKILAAERAANATAPVQAITSLAPEASRVASPIGELLDTGAKVKPVRISPTGAQKLTPEMAADLQRHRDIIDGRLLDGDEFTVLIPTLNKPVAKALDDTFVELGNSGAIQVIDPQSGVPLYIQQLNAIENGSVTVNQLLEGMAAKGFPRSEAFREILMIGKADARKAGQILNRQSQVSKRLAKNPLIKEDPELNALLESLRPGKVDAPGVLRRVYERGLNIWRGSLVSQLSTAMRNLETQGARAGVDVLQQGLDAGIQRMFRLPTTADPLDGALTFMNIFRQLRSPKKILGRAINPKKQDEFVDRLLKEHPKEWDRMYGSFSSDIIARGEKAPFLEKYVDLINTGNKAQEFLVRNSVLQAKLEVKLRNAGKSMEDIVARNAVGEIGPKMLKESVEEALEFTFANSPKSRLAKNFIRWVNEIPFAALAIPFPRFMMNSIKFFYDFSPVGALRLYSPKQLAKIAKGDTSVISRSIIGSGMLGAGWEFRNSEHAGERWYEARVGDRTVDLRPFNPFAAYLFVADIIKRAQENRLSTMSTRDYLQGILGANVRAGTGLFIVDSALEAMAGFKDPAVLEKKLGELSGEIIGGFFTPLSQLKDIYSQFDESQRVIKDRKAAPFLGPALSRIPGGDAGLPALESPTREADLVRESPGLRQLTGLSFRPQKNPAEAEFDRLGFSFNEILKSTGDSTANRLIAKHMGPLVERVISPLVQSPEYLRLSELQKARVLRRAMIKVRGAARRLAIAEDPERFQKLKIRRQPRRERRAIEELLQQGESQ